MSGASLVLLAMHFHDVVQLSTAQEAGSSLLNQIPRCNAEGKIQVCVSAHFEDNQKKAHEIGNVQELCAASWCKAQQTSAEHVAHL